MWLDAACLFKLRNVRKSNERAFSRISYHDSIHRQCSWQRCAVASPSPTPAINVHHVQHTSGASMQAY